jgi:hypothetical protein
MPRLAVQLPWNAQGGLRYNQLNMHGLRHHQLLLPLLQPMLAFSNGGRNQCGSLYKLHVILRLSYLQYVLRLSIPAHTIRLELRHFQSFEFRFLWTGKVLGVPLIVPIMDFLNNSMLPIDSSISTTCTSVLHPLSCPCSESLPHFHNMYFSVAASGASSRLSNPGNFCTYVL